MPLAPHDKLGHYQILGPLGAGGMGEVYRARDLQLEREVAIKVLPPSMANDRERLARFDREAKILAGLNHPNIAVIHDVIESGGQRALVMELVPGETLAARIKRGPLPATEACKIAVQIAEALEAAHEKNVVHRDLKPGNVMITPDGVVKVLDFGLAAVTSPQHAGDPENSPTLTMGMTKAGAIMGTAPYMSPEQATGNVADRRADIWAYGVVFWEMLTGKRLFRGDTVPHTLAAVVQSPIDFGLLHAPEPIRVLIRRCLDRDLKSRLQWIGEARVAVQSHLANPGGAITAPPSRPSFLGWGVAGAFLLLTLALGFVHFREAPPELATQRYTLSMPASTTLHSMALSPDGRQLVMASTDTNGKRQLWLRSMDSLEPKPLASTDGAMYPFWSPDSRFIAFFAEGKLKKVASDGGPSQMICAAIDGRGGTWSRDDVIVFSPSGTTNAVLQRVGAGGGTLTVVAKVSGTPKHPVFLPDQRQFIYSVTDRVNPERGGIYLGSLSGGTLNADRRLLPDVADPVLAPAHEGVAQILFVRENTLMAQPFNTESTQLAGEPFPIAENVTMTTNNSYVPATISDAGLLLYAPLGGTDASMISWFDRSGKHLSDVGSGLRPAISPDQKTLAFSRSGTGGSDIWLSDAERGTERRFTSDPANDVGPVWSPDSSRLAFFSIRSFPYLVLEKAANGSGPEIRLWADPRPSVLGRWTREGIVYTAGETLANNGLYLFPVNGGAAAKPELLLETRFNERHPQLSPDGHWFAYASDESGRLEIYVRPYPVTEDVWRISTTGGVQPRWRADGKELIYRAGDGTLTAVAIKAIFGPEKSVEPGSPEPLFKVSWLENGTGYDYDMTPDAKRYLVSAFPTGVDRPPLTVVVNWDPSRR